LIYKRKGEPALKKTSANETIEAVKQVDSGQLSDLETRMRKLEGKPPIRDLRPFTIGDKVASVVDLEGSHVGTVKGYDGERVVVAFGDEVRTLAVQSVELSEARQATRRIPFGPSAVTDRRLQQAEMLQRQTVERKPFSVGDRVASILDVENPLVGTVMGFEGARVIVDFGLSDAQCTYPAVSIETSASRHGTNRKPFK
jgi:hypothetical protein